jgi:perosamine synthetase
MIRTWQLSLFDFALTLLASIVGLMLRLEIIYVGYFVRQIWPFMLVLAVLRPLIFYVFGVYRQIWRYASRRDYVKIALAVLVGTLIISAITLLWLYPRWMNTFPRSLLVIEGLISLLFSGGLRVVLGNVEKYQGDINWKLIDLPHPKRTLIVGAGSAGSMVLQELVNNPHLGLKPVALLDDDRRKIGKNFQGQTIYGPLANLPDVVKEQQIEEVVIAIPSAPSQSLQNIQKVCQKLELPYSVMPSLSSIFNYSPETYSSYQVPMSMPDITGDEIQAVLRVMQSRNLSMGAQTDTLEKMAAEVAGAAHGVAVINGTAALHLGMLAAGVGPGDEVITSPYSFIASANCILYEKATPVFVDIDPSSYNIDPHKIEAAITERTRAIIPVHIFGQPADMDPILEIAQKHNLVVVEDAAEAIGAHYNGRPVGAIGKAGVFAFYPNKQMTTGEGAVLVTNDEEWSNLFRSLRNQGRDLFNEWLNHSRLGYNYRMSELNAAVGVVQMRRLDELLAKRAAVADEYTRQLSQLEGVTPLSIQASTTRMSWFVYVVRFAESIERNAVMDHLADQNIPSRPYFTPIHVQSFYQDQFGYRADDFPIANAVGASSLALPFYANMNADEIKVVVDGLERALDKARNN